MSNASPLSNDVMEKIEHGQVQMHSRARTRLVRILSWLAFIVVVLVVIYIVSLFFFDLDDSGAWMLPAGGWEGIGAFFLSLPWIVLLLGLIGILILELTGRRELATYRRPILITLAITAALTLGAGWIASRSGLHSFLRHGARHGMVPFFGMMYPHRGMMLQHAVVGTIEEDRPNGFDLEPFGDMDERALIMVTVTPATRIAPQTLLDPGQHVIVFGERMNQTVVARSIHQARGASPMK